MLHTYHYQAVIFDLDGTLIDSSPSILGCFGQALKEAGLQPIIPLSDSLIGPPLRQTLINLTGKTDNALLDRLLDSFKACYDTDGYKATLVYDGVEVMLERLAEYGMPLAIATNKRRIPTMKIIEHLGWEKYFRIVGTLDTPASPHINKAALIQFLLNEMGVAAEKSLYIGDKWEDGEAAAANSMAFCAAGWGYGEWNKAKMLPDWQVSSSAPELTMLCLTGCSTDQMTLNLQKTARIIDAVFELKLAFIRSQHIGISESEAQQRIYSGILKRKERQWTFQEGS